MEIQSPNVVGTDLSGPFLRGFTHDLRTPLFAMLGYLQLLQRNLEMQSEPAKALEYLRYAQEAGLRMDGMVTDMLDWARFGQGSASMRVGPVSVGDLFRRLWKTFSVIAREKQISLRLVIKDDEALTISADIRFFERALDNLIGNAIKFNRPEGHVVVTAAREESKIIFRVSDTGLGIPPESQKLIFEPFAQVRPSDRSMGFGLGLPIVQFIAQAHGGGVELTSNPGSGSCFTLWIPVTGLEEDHGHV